MGQKTHPAGFRTGIIFPWQSTWFAKKDYPEFIAEDNKIRKFVKKKLYTAGVSKILISRKSQNVTVTIVTAKPGIVVGRGGQGIEELKALISKLVNKNVSVDVVEAARIDADAQLAAESIAIQLEKRIAFRRAMKQVMQRAMRGGAQGIKVMVSGRLGGAEIARSEWAKEGRIPLQTLRANIDYGFAEADTIMGKIGVKVWIFKGLLLPGETADMNIKLKKASAKDYDEKPSGGRRGKKKSAQAQPVQQTESRPAVSDEQE